MYLCAKKFNYNHLINNKEKDKSMKKNIFDLYSDEILNRTEYRTDEECARLNECYYIPTEKQSLIRQYISNREFHKVCLEDLIPDSLQQRVRSKIKIDEHYQDSIDRILIPELENKISGDNISFALHSKKYLKLDTAHPIEVFIIRDVK